MQPTPAFVKVLLVLPCSLAFVSLFSQVSSDEWKARISRDMVAIGITADDAAECIVSSSFTDASSNIHYAYLQQTYQQLRVFNNIITIAYKNDRLVYTAGHFIKNVRQLSLSATPSVEAATALLASVRHLRLREPVAVQTTQNRFQSERKIVFAAAGIAKKDIETELLWVQDDTGRVHLAWNVNIDVAGSPDWWNVRVDARSGEIVSKDNWTVHEGKPMKQSNDNPERIERRVIKSNPFAVSHLVPAQRVSPAPLWSPPNVTNGTYQVVPFPNASKYFASVAIETNPWQMAGTSNRATTYGWHFDGKTNYLITRGNNVWAYDDSLNKNQPGRVATSTTPAPSVSFNFSPDFSKQPFDSINRSFNITNLFYWNNVAHDIAYQYGFDEQAGNFQNDNMGRGGAEGDPVKAEAQDGSSTNNANFTIAPDGNSGRMQMFLWSPPTVLSVLTPSQVAGDYASIESDFSTNNKLSKTGPIIGEVVFYENPVGSVSACDSTAAPFYSVSGKVALIHRGNCSFVDKFRAAQKYGAVGVIMVNNVVGSPIIMAGTDNTITIPGIMISQEDGEKIAAYLSKGIKVKMNTTGIYLDGDIDNAIITHEYGHGISTRLTGGRLNTSCLSNVEQGGEGWSDYIALMLTTNWSTAQLTDGTKLRAMASYAAGQTAAGLGVRRVPYTTDMLIDTLTYASMAASTEAHDIGEIWCSALWDMTWNIIQHEGKITPTIYNSSADGGNVIALRLVIEGMKLQPCRPGFVDARNAILVADSLLFNNRHKCDIWRAFARRGMGVSASQGSSNNATDQVAAFDIPSGILLSKAALPASVSPKQQTTVDLKLTCQCAVPTVGFTITDTIPAGFSYINSTGGIVTGNVVKFTSISFNNALESRTLSVTLLAADSGCDTLRVVNDNRDTDSTGGFTPAHGVLDFTDWVPSSTRAHSGARAWWAPDSSWFSNSTLTSAPFAVGSLSVLSFWHYFVTVSEIDGGKVEISVNNGTTWTDAGPYFLQNCYNTKLNNLALTDPNTPAFSGTSYGTGSANKGQFIQSLVNLSAFSGKTIRIRFRFSTGFSIYSLLQHYEGWYIDDITVTNGCGGINRITLTGSSGKTDSLNIPVFITPVKVLPYTMVSLNARQEGTKVLLQWHAVAESNTKDYTIEHSFDGHIWTALGSVPAGSSSGSYNYVDEHPLLGIPNYYRIRITDDYGQYTFTVIRAITLFEIGTMTIGPNPARGQTVVYLGGKVAGSELQLIDMSGKVLQRQRFTENVLTYTLKTTGLPAGTYLVQLQLRGGIVTKKLLVER